MRLLSAIIVGLSALTPAMSADMARLSIRPVAAVYSSSLDQIVMVSATPDQISVWNTTQHAITATISLPLPPTALALSPDGRTAAVGHNGRISIVDLSPLNLRKTVPVSCDVLSIVYGPNEWVYALPRTDQWTSIRSVSVSTGTEINSSNYYSFYAGSTGIWMPGTNSLYIAQNGISPDHIQKFDVSAGTVAYLYDWSYHGTYSACGYLWPSPDGRRIFTRCGSVFRASSVKSEDMTYNGKLASSIYPSSIAVSLSNNRILATGATSYYTYSGSTEQGTSLIYVFGYENLNAVANVRLPQFTVLGKNYAGYGRYVFINSAEDRWFAIEQADTSSGLLNDYAISWGRLAGFVLNSATRLDSVLAPDQLATVFVDLGSVQSATATSNPAPGRLSGIEVKVIGSDGTERYGRVVDVMAGQLKFVVPADVPAGPALIYVDDFNRMSRTILDATIQNVAPGVFTASGDGTGAPDGTSESVPASGDTSYAYLYKRASSSDSSIVPNPIVITGQACTTATGKYYLNVIATGLRHASVVTATLGVVTVPVSVTADPDTDGRERLRIGPLPTTGLSSSTYSLVITADGVASNSTTIQLQFK